MASMKCCVIESLTVISLSITAGIAHGSS